MEEKEFAKQIYNYADAVTAFAFVQGIGFAFEIGQNDTLACNVGCFWFFAVPIIAIMNCLFFFIVNRCHYAEDRLLGVDAAQTEKVGVILSGVRKMRLYIISFIGLGELALGLGLRFYPPGPHCS